MNRFLVSRRSYGGILVASALCFGAPRLGAQLVTPKTVPIHQNEQFSIFPSARYGMGNVSIALDDTLLDPFINPARAARIRMSSVFTTPYFHDVSSGRGGGHTLPAGGFAAMGEWSGAGLVAIQQLNQGTGFGQAISERTAANQYAVGVLARRLPNGVSVGGSVYLAGLEAVDGVDLLYAGSDRLDQSGTLVDFRLGMTKSWDDTRRLDVVLMHNRTNMAQVVHFTNWVWDPIPRTSRMIEREEHNEDRTNIWGGHARFTRPVGKQGWRLGLMGTANHLSHPKIPNYQIQNIPRDPGTTYGYNVGAGVGRVTGTSSFGIDIVEEPMFSTTWADAARDTLSVNGTTIKAGQHTVDNHFRFSNVKMRVGFGTDIPMSRDSSSALGLQVGLSVHSINYRLKQTNFVLRTYRVQDEGWTEWTPTFGLGWRAKDFQVQYSYRRTCGPSDCFGFGSQQVVFGVEDVAVPSTGGVIAAPSAPLTIDGGTVRAHQISVFIPIR